MWKEFNIKSLGEYTELYNKVDVLQLTHVFENIRDVCRKKYKSDPAWYYTAPGLAMISKRYGKAKNKYTNDKVNSSKSSKYIQ